ncbi:MAG: ATP-binding cassette domain-containing protein [Eubacterium sp.]|nr:ATP-binding cassette domain-containing protein [Eubacterium sp.]
MKLNEKYRQALLDMTDSLQGENQMEDALSNAVEILKETIGCEIGFVWLLDSKSDKLFTSTSAFGLDKTGVSIGKYIGTVGHAMETAESAIYTNAIKEDSPLAGTDDATGVRAENQMVTPLRTPGGQPFGVLQLINKSDGKSFDEMDRQLSENVSALIAIDIVDKKFELDIPTDREPMITLRGITREFQAGDNVIKVLKGIDLDIYPCEFLVVLGESGCGKTTMMNIVGGMDTMTDGTMTLDGEDFSHPSNKQLTEYRRNYIGYIFQAYNLMPNLSALENLQFIAEISKDPRSPEDMLALVGLSERAGNFPSQMSGGQQQRVSIARALTKNPKLILADEPTAALDYETSIEVLSIVEKIVKEENKTVVMITHNPEIAKMANRVVKVRGGKIASIRININPLHATDLVW